MARFPAKSRRTLQQHWASHGVNGLGRQRGPTEVPMVDHQPLLHAHPRSFSARIAENSSASTAPGPTVAPIACNTGTFENASTPKPITVVVQASTSDASVAIRYDLGALVEEQRIVGADRHDQQHADEVEDVQVCAASCVHGDDDHDGSDERHDYAQNARGRTKRK